jgi:hypothetical protein
LESALVHVRNLVEFFFGDDARDVNVRDFLDSGAEGLAWRKSKPKNTGVGMPLAKRISVWLSHFSRDRRGPNPEWDIGAYTRSLLRLLSAFIQVVRPTRREWFDWTEEHFTFDDTSMGILTTTATMTSTTVVLRPGSRGAIKIVRERNPLAVQRDD